MSFNKDCKKCQLVRAIDKNKKEMALLRKVTFKYSDILSKDSVQALIKQIGFLENQNRDLSRKRVSDENNN